MFALGEMLSRSRGNNKRAFLYYYPLFGQLNFGPAIAGSSRLYVQVALCLFLELKLLVNMG